MHTSDDQVPQVPQTVSAVQSLFLAMVLYPEVQSQAHKDLDAVVGPDRLLTFEDRPSLPYLEAIVSESLRLHMVLPIGPHLEILQSVLCIDISDRCSSLHDRRR